MKKVLALLSLLAMFVMLSGCCNSQFGSRYADCDNSLGCDIQKLVFNMDEFTMDYVRNSAVCLSGGPSKPCPDCTATTSTSESNYTSKLTAYPAEP